jgi:HSP20 family protein
MVTRSFTTLDRVFTLNRALDQALTTAWGQARSNWVPAIDIVEKKDVYEVHAELPGVAPEHVEIGFEKNVLAIRGAKQSAVGGTKEESDLRVHASERLIGSFERTIRLPEFVDAEHIDATFENGLLTVTIPKAKAAQPRRIQIRADRKPAETPAAEAAKN